MSFGCESASDRFTKAGSEADGREESRKSQSSARSKESQPNEAQTSVTVIQYRVPRIVSYFLAASSSHQRGGVRISSTRGLWPCRYKIQSPWQEAVERGSPKMHALATLEQTTITVLESRSHNLVQYDPATNGGKGRKVSKRKEVGTKTPISHQ